MSQIDQISNQLGELLMQGYTMLADSCPECAIPLMRAPNSDTPICVCCGGSGAFADDEPDLSLPNGHPQFEDAAVSEDDDDNVQHEQVDYEEEVLEAPPPLRERLGGQPVDQEETLQEQDHHNNDEDPSQIIADRLLEGWAMLADYCPMCFTPLLRDKEGTIHCVKCKMPVRYEGNAASTTILAAKEDTTTTTTTAVDEKQGETILAEQTTSQYPGSAPAIIETIVHQQFITQEEDEEDNIDDDNEVQGDVEKAVDMSLLAVANRMKTLSTSLSNASIDQGKSLVADIRECTAALNDLLEVKGNFS